MQLWTTFGYPLDEIASALQKTIRRGEEEQALWFAHELEARFHQYLWLGVIACEDIGPANPAAVTIVNACRESYCYHRNTNTRGASDPNYLTHAETWAIATWGAFIRLFITTFSERRNRSGAVCPGPLTGTNRPEASG